MRQVEELVTGGDQGGCETYSPGRVTVQGTLAASHPHGSVPTLFVSSIFFPPAFCCFGLGGVVF